MIAVAVRYVDGCGSVPAAIVNALNSKTITDSSSVVPSPTRWLVLYSYWQSMSTKSTNPKTSTSSNTPAAGSEHENSGGTPHNRYAEGNLATTWRRVIQSAILVASRAEKAVDPATQKELRDRTKEFVLVRKEFGKTVTSVSDRLEGKEAEMQCREHYLRTQPTLRKKRKLNQEVITLD